MKLRKPLNHLPRTVSRAWKNLQCRLRGEPPICYRPLTPARIRDLVARPDPVILEIGCNDGQDTLRFLEVFENPRIYCFEPDPRAIARFRNTVDERPGVSLFEIALGDREGEVEFFQSGGSDAHAAHEMPAGWDLSGSLRKPKRHLEVHPWVTFEHVITVPLLTLDAWCAGNGIGEIDFIWMDVQGAEADVIRGGAAALARTRFLYTEYSDEELYEGQVSLAGLRAALNGFSLMTRYPEDVLFRNLEFR